MDAYVESTPGPQEESTVAPRTAERAEIPKFAQVRTGKEFLLPDTRRRSHRDQVSGETATAAANMRQECKRVQAVSYQVRSETAEGLDALREAIKTNGGALWEDGIFMKWGCITPTHTTRILVAAPPFSNK